MDISNEKIHHTSQFFFNKGKNVSLATETFIGAYVPDIVRDKNKQFWFLRFRSANFDVKGEQRSGRPIYENIDKLRALFLLPRS